MLIKPVTIASERERDKELLKQYLVHAFQTGDWGKFETIPKPSCRRCWGKGWMGIDKKNKSFVICPKCMKKIKLKGEPNASRKPE